MLMRGVCSRFHLLLNQNAKIFLLEALGFVEVVKVDEMVHRCYAAVQTDLVRCLV